MQRWSPWAKVHDDPWCGELLATDGVAGGGQQLGKVPARKTRPRR
jgi:hypothetical protein